MSRKRFVRLLQNKTVALVVLSSLWSEFVVLLSIGLFTSRITGKCQSLFSTNPRIFPAVHLSGQDKTAFLSQTSQTGLGEGLGTTLHLARLQIVLQPAQAISAPPSPWISYGPPGWEALLEGLYCTQHIDSTE